MERNLRKERIGLVVSDKMDKTVVVEISDNDFIEKIYPATMHNTMLFFTDRGRCYWLKVYDIPEGTKGTKGRAIQNLLQL